MQVSWIDKEQLRGLLERLGDGVPQAKPGAAAWETHTMPALPVEPQEPMKPAPVPVPVPAALPAAPAVRAPVEEAKVVKEAEGAPGMREDDVEEGARPEDVAPEVARIRDRLREVRERAEAAGLLRRLVPQPGAKEAGAEAGAAGVTVAAGAGETGNGEVRSEVSAGSGAEAAEGEWYFEVPVGTVVERLEAFAEWGRRRVEPGELVLLDEHGDVLWGAQAKGALILSAMLAAKAAGRSSAAGARQAGESVVRQALGSGGELAVLSCETRAGRIHLAVEHPGKVEEALMRRLGEALELAIQAGA